MTVLMPSVRPGQQEHWLTFDEFTLLADRGAFGSSRHVELMDGRIIDLAPISNDHLIGASDLGYALRRALEDAGLAQDRVIGGPVTVKLSPTRAPEPDAVVARRTRERWLTSSDLELVAEIAVTSQDYDLGEKALAYAEAGVPEYWVVDRAAGRLHVMRKPKDGAYTDVPPPLGPGATVSPLFAPDISIPVADLL